MRAEVRWFERFVFLFLALFCQAFCFCFFGTVIFLEFSKLIDSCKEAEGYVFSTDTVTLCLNVS